MNKEKRCQAPKILILILGLLVSSMLTAGTLAPIPTKDCAVKAKGSEGHAEVCMEGTKKFCPKGYTIKQKARVCPPGKMCAAVMEEFCEKMAAK